MTKFDLRLPTRMKIRFAGNFGATVFPWCVRFEYFVKRTYSMAETFT